MFVKWIKILLEVYIHALWLLIYRIQNKAEVTAFILHYIFFKIWISTEKIINKNHIEINNKRIENELNSIIDEKTQSKKSCVGDFMSLAICFKIFIIILLVFFFKFGCFQLIFHSFHILRLKMKIFYIMVAGDELAKRGVYTRSLFFVRVYAKVKRLMIDSSSTSFRMRQRNGRLPTLKKIFFTEFTLITSPIFINRIPCPYNREIKWKCNFLFLYYLW